MKSYFGETINHGLIHNWSGYKWRVTGGAVTGDSTRSRNEPHVTTPADV